MPFIEFIVVTGLGVFLGIFIVNLSNDRSSRKILDDAFYRLIEAQSGRISLIQLAAAAKMDASIAQKYLERQVEIFSALPEVNEQGDTFYRFPQLSLPPGTDTNQW
ncbi:MAG: hypothetical protein SXA11_18485 [Cyanobacteriota bacterium]|nr:hypothetical protein [Cyanobacteriota bacterium]